MTISAAISIGIGVGAALFAATGEEYWIAMGAAIGTVLGVSMQATRH